MQDKRSGNMWVWVGIVIVVIIVILVFVWKPTPSQAPGSSASTSTVTPVYATQGQLTPGFPQSLILDPAAKINSSYTINYSTNGNQHTAEWNSSSSMKTLFNEYKAYLSSNGWTITGTTSKPALGSIYATNASTSVSVTIYPKNGGEEVIVGYLE